AGRAVSDVRAAAPRRARAVAQDRERPRRWAAARRGPRGLANGRSSARGLGRAGPPRVAPRSGRRVPVRGRPPVPDRRGSAARTLAGALAGLREGIRTHCQAAQRYQPLAENAPLARSHGTTYPILQGPMTRVSDTAAFAASVAEAGALPFLALALLRGPEVRA